MSIHENTERMACGAGQGAAQQLSETTIHREVIAMLIDVARKAEFAMDDTMDDGNGLHWNKQSFDDLSAAMDKLEDFPDDRPGYTMGPAAKAEWALRPLLQPNPAHEAEKPSVTGSGNAGEALSAIVDWAQEAARAQPSDDADMAAVGRALMEEIVSDDAFYLQDSRSYVGNDVLWWAQDGKGYTTDLSKAQVYTKADAVAQHESRETDIPWPKDYIDKKTRPAVDMQYVNRGEALAGTGIVLRKPPRKRQHVQNCIGCGRFLNFAQVYLEDCPKCGADNRP